MNPLAKLKEKLMVKPNVADRERVAVIIKGTKKLQKPVNVNPQEATKAAPLIVDETQTGFNRDDLFKKLAENKKLSVTVKRVVKDSEERMVVPMPATAAKKVKKLETKKRLIIEEDGDEDLEAVNPPAPNEEEAALVLKPKPGAEEEVEEVIKITAPKKKTRITNKIEKGVAILGPETLVEIGETSLADRLPRPSPPVLIKASSYYMNNREIFVNFINSLFEPYRKELAENKDAISCDTIGQTGTDFSLLTHQKIVRDYMNLYTPYRGLLLYHGLGSGKTCTSIAIAEGMKSAKRVIILTPASLRANYVEELKKCGDLLYKRNQFWEWINTENNLPLQKTISALLNLPEDFIIKNGGAFFVNVKESSNYHTLDDVKKKILEAQLNEMIKQKYQILLIH